MDFAFDLQHQVEQNEECNEGLKEPYPDEDIPEELIGLLDNKVCWECLFLGDLHCYFFRAEALIKKKGMKVEEE